MPIQSPQAYTARPFDEPQPTPPARKPPALQQIKRTDYAEKGKGDKQYKDAVSAANAQYERENAAYATEKSQYDKDIQDWRSRKAAWDAGEGTKVGQSGEGQKRLENYLASPEGKTQQNWNSGMLAAPMMPSALLSTYVNRNMRNPAAKIGFGMLEGAAGEGLRKLEQQQQPDQYTDPAGHYGNEMWQNFLLSSGMGAGLGSIRSALMKPKSDTGATPLTPPEPPRAPPVETYKGSPTEVARAVAHDLGLGGDLSPKDTKADIINRNLAAIRSSTATPEQIATVAQKAKGVNPETFLVDRLLKSTKPLTSLAAILGVGAAAGAIAPGEAEAATPRTATPKQPETSSDLSDLEREYGTGLPKGKARQALKGAADTALTMAPVAGEARMALDAPHLYNPSDQDLADTEAWQRGREEMAKPHEAAGGAINPDHLPEHERAHLDNPEELLRRGFWQLPYLATGRHMVGLTGDSDTFFGGKTPEHQQIYDDTLRANKALYENAFKRLANKSPHSTPEQPVADEAPVAKEGLRHGGKVNRKVVSIADHFEKRLSNKTRQISALEKANTRRPNQKLARKLEMEKETSGRMQRHIKKVKSHF